MQTGLRNKTSLEFCNSIILILAILNDDSKELNCIKEKNAYELQDYKKEKMMEILRKEFL